MKGLIFTALLLTACQRDSRYFGNTTPPAGQRLVFSNGGEPATLDPVYLLSTVDTNVAGILFEGLVLLSPVAPTPIAGMATHYVLSADGKEYTFYLRGHPAPRGTRLPDIDSLPTEFTHGAVPPPDSVPAHWSDGSIVTAADFVYSWRRFADPRVASPYGSKFELIVNGRDILAGKRPPDQLGVKALDDFTLRVRLETPAPNFLELASQWYPVPRKAVERARRDGHEATWTQPGRIIGNGPFLLKEWRPYDYLKVVRNSRYYERDLVRLEEISFLPLGDSAPAINLYRAGLLHSTVALPDALIPALKSAPDFRNEPQLGTFFLTINVHAPPLDNPLLRWAVNMALDKVALADFSSVSPARQLVPPMPGYTPPERVVVEVKGKKYDVLAHDPVGARELLAAAGYPGGVDRNGNRLTFPINVGSKGDPFAEILRYQLQTTLNVDAEVNPMEYNVLLAALVAGTLRGLSYQGWTAESADPVAFFGPEVMGWRDPVFEAALKDANATLDPGLRMKQLAQCESRLLEAMPIIPVTFNSNTYLAKPYVHALHADPLGIISFRYAWIDNGWKP